MSSRTKPNGGVERWLSLDSSVYRFAPLLPAAAAAMPCQAASPKPLELTVTFGLLLFEVADAPLTSAVLMLQIHCCTAQTVGEYGNYAMKRSGQNRRQQEYPWIDPSISRAALEAELTRRASAIRTAMEKLPLVEASGSDELHKEARFLSWLSSLTFGLDLPRGREVSVTVAQTELRTLISLMEKLRNHILRMHNTSLDAVARVVDEAVTSKPPPAKVPSAHWPWRWAAPTPPAPSGTSSILTPP
jgi:hypothetical protein